MISKGNKSFHFVDLDSLRISDADLASTYLGVTKVPCLIKSPFREDSNPSLQLSSLDGEHIVFYDYGTKQGGNMVYLLSLLWQCDVKEVYLRLEENFQYRCDQTKKTKTKKATINKSCDSMLHCKVRMWNKDDAAYWTSYGVNRKWLKFADVYPISHKIVEKNGKIFAFSCDKLAYAFVEFRDGKPLMKLYQPLNKGNYKWQSKLNRNIISLWTKIPEKGKNIVICSSLKDALCLWSHVGVPCIAPQGEGYLLPNDVVKSLKERFENVYICYDNDTPGITDAKRLSEATGFQVITLPAFEGGKDISDYFKSLKDKRSFKSEMIKLFNFKK